MPKKNRIKPDVEPASVVPVRVQCSVGLLAETAEAEYAEARVRADKPK